MQTTSTPHLTDEQRRMAAENYRLVPFVVNRMARNGTLFVEYDDALSLGAMGLMRAAQGYQHNRGAQFSTYAVLAIRGHISSETRKNRRRKRWNGQSTISLDAPLPFSGEPLIDQLPSEAPGPEEIVFQQEEYRAVRKALQKLPALDAQIAHALASGLSQSEAAGPLGISQTCVCRHYKAGRQRIRDELIRQQWEEKQK